MWNLDLKMTCVLYLLHVSILCTLLVIVVISCLHPGLPAREQSAEVFGVHGLLDEQVDLPADAKYCALLQPFQLLLQPQQHPLRHLVEALTVTAAKRCTRRGQNHHYGPQ